MCAPGRTALPASKLHGSGGGTERREGLQSVEMPEGAMTNRWTSEKSFGDARAAAGRPALPSLVRTDRPPGLYDPRDGKDSCGVGFIVNLRKEKSHRIIESGLTILENLEHRGAVGADPLMGDGAGIMVQTPHRFLRRRGRKARHQLA